MYRLGDQVLLSRLMGEDINPPVRVQVTGVQMPQKGRLLEYEVTIHAKSRETGREVKDLKCWVKREWLAPAHIVIQEAPETPFD